MDRKDLKALVPTAVVTIANAAHVSTVVGTGVDLKGYYGSMAEVTVGLWTDATHTFSVQDSADNSTFAAVDASLLNGTITVVDGTADDNVIYLVGYHGTKRYLKVGVVVAGATTGAVYGAQILRGFPREQASTLVD